MSAATTHTLVVVESPNKIQKIQKCLGDGFEVLATAGHFRGLPDDELGVDVDSDFRPKYVVSADKRSVVSKLREAQRRCSTVLLATDADREGEAISWHVAQELKLRLPMRLRFQEITPAALKRGLENLTPLDQHLVDAQQARRVLDRLVGFQVSPLLNPLGTNHSAGRVQSAALHLVVTRELERDRFKATPFWTLTVAYSEGFQAVAAVKNGETWSRHRFSSEQEATAAHAAAKPAAHRVEAIETKRDERRPRPPFTTSSLQQAASARLGFAPKKTMELAQKLFEQGLITYHRTDSVALSAEAVEMARGYLQQRMPAALPAAAVTYRSSGSAQEAHEAVRPTALEHAERISEDEQRLFELIRSRFLACQCKPALVDRTTVRTEGGGVRFLASGDVVVFHSWLELMPGDEHTEAQKTDAPEEGDSQPLPRVKEAQALHCLDLELQRKSTVPPPRFTEATLVREMEKSGIGRPSTYASTIATLFTRQYLELQKKAVAPTQRGRVVDGVLSTAFPALVKPDYTAEMEQQLDQVAAGELPWKRALQQWHPGFVEALDGAPAAIAAFYNAHREWVDSVNNSPKRTGKKCLRCQSELLERTGKNGPFLSCSAYPRCSFSCSTSAEASTLPCPKCQGPMLFDTGKFGTYRQCVSSSCAHRVDEARLTEHVCPRCQQHHLQDKVSFLACEDKQTCGFTISQSDLEASLKKARRCSQCQHLMVVRRGKRGSYLGCSAYPRCRQTEEMRSAAVKRSGATR